MVFIPNAGCTAPASLPASRRLSGKDCFNMVEKELPSSILSCKTSYKFSLRDKKTGEVRTFIMGPGLAELLHGVERLGSLRQAAAAMEMSYSKAWTHVRRAEQICGAKLTRPAAGGEGGGGSQLTEEGQWLLDTYDAFVKEADEQVKQLMERYFTRDLPFS